MAISELERMRLYEEARQAARRERGAEMHAVKRDNNTHANRATFGTPEPLARPAHELARTADVETSHVAAAANREGKAAHRRLVLEAHARRPAGLIDDEAAQVAGLESVETTRRSSDLRRDGLIEWLLAEGKPVTRLTRSGRPARVSVITPTGRAALA